MKEFLTELAKTIPDQHIHTDTESLNYYSVKGTKPSAVVAPSSVEEVSELVRFCRSQGLKLLPCGNGTKLQRAEKPLRVDIALTLRNLDQLVHHARDDFTATAQCGMTLGNFQKEIGRTNQLLPLDPPHIRNGATLGGIIATNDYGPSRPGYGTCRELLLEIKAVRSDGKLIKGGAKVVKNVAGYDIPKLYVGSLGTLGILVESTFRLYPVSAYSKTIVICLNDRENAGDIVRNIRNANIIPTSTEVTNSLLTSKITGFGSSGEESTCGIFVRIKNIEQAVEDQINKIEYILDPAIPRYLINGEEEQLLWENIRDFSFSYGNSSFVLRASVLLNNVLRLINYTDEIAQNLNTRIHCSGNFTNGTVIIHLEGDLRDQLMATHLLRSHVDSLEGNLDILKCPEAASGEIDIWGNMGSSISIMKKIRQNFDPEGMFVPERMF